MAVTRIVINFDEENHKTSLEEGTVNDLFEAIILGGSEFSRIILDGIVTIIANTKHPDLLLSDLFRSLAIAREDPVAIEEAGLSKEQPDELKKLLGENLASIIKPTGDA